MNTTRRTFLMSTAAAAAVAGTRVGAQTATALPVIDAHIHLFDPRRPQGVPYAGPRVPGVAPVPALPDRYRGLAVPLGVVGAIKVEASPWIEDNLWALQVAETDPIIVGVIGNLEPEKPEFAEYLDRYRKNPLFRGIRCGNLWGRDIAAQVNNASFVQGIKRLADADLVMDTANPNMALLGAIIRLTDAVPNLRVVLDHMAGYDPAPAEQGAYDAALGEIGKRPQIYVKISQIIHAVNGRVAADVGAYRARIDTLVGAVGENRIIFGSDWPNSDGVTSIDRIMSVAHGYFDAQPRSIAEKYFWKNSLLAYKWSKRAPNQPAL